MTSDNCFALLLSEGAAALKVRMFFSYVDTSVALAGLAVVSELIVSLS